MKTKIEIKSWLSGSLLFEFETEDNSILRTLKEAIRQGAYLQGADLLGAHLQGADLQGVDLQDAYLQDAHLQGADLRGAYLRGAYLRGVHLQGAHLQGADVRGAYLGGVDLTGVDLTGLDLKWFKNDFWAVLCDYPTEAEGVKKALVEGRVNGSTYSGECACLIGTISNIKKCKVEELEKDSNRPAEQWFLGINEGDTPETNTRSKIAVQWIDEWLAKVRQVSTGQNNAQN